MASRQEVLNVILAQLLQERGLVAAPEEILKGPTQETRLPDVVVDFQGLRLAIEAEFGVQNRRVAWDKARRRVEEAIAHIGVGVVYPARLKQVRFERLRDELQRCALQYAVFTEANEPTGQLLLFKKETEPSFSKGDVDNLGETIRRSYDQLVQDETLDRAVQVLQTIIDGFMAALEAQPATTDRLAEALGIERVPESNPRARRAVNRIAALILANAMVFQEVLSKADQRVLPLQRFRKREAIISSMADHWAFILDEINYYPIFKTALDLIRCISADVALTRTYGNLLETALNIVGCRASLRHDLAGRIYHRLLEEAKYLGAYYTSIPAATLLLKLCIQSNGKPSERSRPTAIPELCIADLACGTGTLLMASADALMDKYVRECAQAGVRPDLKNFHRDLIENMIYGYDVLPSAIHLTASTLALRLPETPVNVTHLYSMPLGGNERHLGSLEFLEKDVASGTLFGETQQITGKGAKGGAGATIPALDFCVMNPPFTRSVGGNLLFGSVPEEQRRPMQQRLQRIVRRKRVPASITAGLGTAFVALADDHIKPGGAIALVLPRALLSGVAWKRTRQLLHEKYHMQYVIVSHEPDHWNFSENTDLSEVLVVARKRTPQASRRSERTTFVNLWRQPRNAIEALSVASSLVSGKPSLPVDRVGSRSVRLGWRQVGEAICTTESSPEVWGAFCAFAQPELVFTLRGLMQNELQIPGSRKTYSLPLCKLTELGDLGFDCRDIHDGFARAERKTGYPAFWNHDAAAVRKLSQEPNTWLAALEKPRKGRHLRSAEHLWTKSSRVLVAERLRLNTMRLGSLLISQPVLSNVWWPFCFSCDLQETQAAQKSLVLWLNSSLGILLTLGRRVETEGPWIKFKKPLLEALPVLDVRRLRKERLSKLASAFDELAHVELLPFSEIAADSMRAVIDQKICETLGIPDITILRTLLGREPVVCLDLRRLEAP